MASIVELTLCLGPTFAATLPAYCDGSVMSTNDLCQSSGHGKGHRMTEELLTEWTVTQPGSKGDLSEADGLDLDRTRANHYLGIRSCHRTVLPHTRGGDVSMLGIA